MDSKAGLSWASIILMVIAMVAAPIAYHFNTKIDSLDAKLQKEYQLVNDTMAERVRSEQKSLAELDTRLQKEFGVAQENVKVTAIALKDAWREEHTALVGRVKVLEDWNMDRIKGDLEELRQRRMKQ